jgi:RNA polymerase sigma-70 factor (ECF subfamily)
VLPIEDSSVDGGLGTVADRDELDRGFRRISIDHRAVVVLHYYLDKPLDEVARILEIPVGTAHSRLHHAMRALRAALDADARRSVREVAR